MTKKERILFESHAPMWRVRDVDQVGAAGQATAMKAKLFGFMVDRQQVQVEHTLRKPSADENAPAEMSLEDWQAKYGGSSGPGLADGRNGKLIEHEH